MCTLIVIVIIPQMHSAEIRDLWLYPSQPLFSLMGGGGEESDAHQGCCQAFLVW